MSNSNIPNRVGRQSNSPIKVGKMSKQNELVNRSKQRKASNFSIENCYIKLKNINEKIEKIDLKMEIKDIIRNKEAFSIDKLNTMIEDNKMKQFQYNKIKKNLYDYEIWKKSTQQ